MVLINLFKSNRVSFFNSVPRMPIFSVGRNGPICWKTVVFSSSNEPGETGEELDNSSSQNQPAGASEERTQNVGKKVEGKSTEFPVALQAIQTAFLNVRQNLTTLFGETSTISQASPLAKKVELKPQQITPIQEISYPGIGFSNKSLVLTTKTLVTVTLTYSVDLTPRFLGKSSFTEHSVVFNLVPDGTIKLDTITLLDCVRNQVYAKINKLQHTGVTYKGCRIQVFNLSQAVNRRESFNSSIVSAQPSVDILVGFTGRGAQPLPETKLTKQEREALTKALIFGARLVTGETENPRDTNRFSVLGHWFLTSSQLYAEGPQNVGGNSFLVEGSPIGDILEFCFLFSKPFEINGLPFYFYETFKGRKSYRFITNLILVGLRPTGATLKDLNLEE